MATVRCPYCHERIDEASFAAHEAEHRQTHPDGPPSDLAGVPRVYVHQLCGAHMKMPEAIIRGYLANPYLSLSDETFCGGCCRHVPNRECSWTETGENLQAYVDQLRAARPELNPVKESPPKPPTPMGDGCLGALLALLVVGAALLIS